MPAPRPRFRQRPSLALAALVAVAGLSAHAQTASSLPSVSTTVTVLGSPEPVTLGESTRATVVLDTVAHPLAFSQVEDYLRTDASTFISQRGAGGSQADISVRGTSFEQTLVLLNGLRINDAETSHNNLDLPVPLSALAGIDVLHGAGSTLYGSDALGGVVDFYTSPPDTPSLLLRAGGGNYGTSEQEGVASLVGRRWSERVAGQRDASTGFMTDRDYRDGEASSETRWTSRAGITDVLLAAGDRAFGANQFYGNYPSYERTKGWFASITQALGERTQAAFGYRRHTDQYVLVRGNPALYQNDHIDSSWEAALRRNGEPNKHLKLFYGLETDGDAIHSNNLGVHARNWGSAYLDAEIRGGHATLSAGLRQEILSGGYHVTSPMLAAAYHLSAAVKLRAAAGYGFRLPTYLDLYYNDPTTIGNPALKPESAWNVEAGVDWFAGEHLSLRSTVFYSRQHNAIDYVRADPSQRWMAANLSGLRFIGWENSAVWQPGQANLVTVSWTLLAGAQQALHGLQSKYVFNYPVNNASIEALHTWRAGYTIRTRIGVTARYQQPAYAVWDLSLARERGPLRPYLRLTNLANTGYQEVLAVQMPGRAVIAGLQLTLTHKHP